MNDTEMVMDMIIKLRLSEDYRAGQILDAMEAGDGKVSQEDADYLFKKYQEIIYANRTMSEV